MPTLEDILKNAYIGSKQHDYHLTVQGFSQEHPLIRLRVVNAPDAPTHTYKVVGDSVVAVSNT